MKKDITDILIRLFGSAVIVIIIAAVVGAVIFFATLFLLGHCL